MLYCYKSHPTSLFVVRYLISICIRFSSEEKKETISSVRNPAAIANDNPESEEYPYEELDHDGQGEPQYESLEAYDKLSPSYDRLGSKAPRKLYADCPSYEPTSVNLS